MQRSNISERPSHFPFLALNTFVLQPINQISPNSVSFRYTEYIREESEQTGNSLRNLFFKLSCISGLEIVMGKESTCERIALLNLLTKLQGRCNIYQQWQCL